MASLAIFIKAARARFAAFYSPQNHKIVVAGGVGDGHFALDTVEEFPVLFRGEAHSSLGKRKRN